MILDHLAAPIVLAPLAGGPSTPQLAAAVSNAGGLGFLAAGYLSAPVVQDRLARTRIATSRPIGVNLFVPGTPAAPKPVIAYAAMLTDDARQAGVALGPARFDDDDWGAKLGLLTTSPVEVVSFTFGCPDSDVTSRLHAVDSEVWVTVTTAAEARQAVQAGADVVVVQGAEAGGHRASFRDDPGQDLIDGLGLLSLLQLVGQAVDVPVVATGGIMTGSGVAATLAVGAAAAQLGTAFLRCPEAGTAAVYRQALAGDGATVMTRAFTGRLARGIRNRFIDQHNRDAPAAYPEVHHLTAPLRHAGRGTGDADLVNLWAGQTHQLGQDLAAGELVHRLAHDAQLALETAGARFPTPKAP